MADDEDRYIGWRVVGALMEEFLAAIWADVVDLEIGAEHPALAAGGAIVAQAFADSLPYIAGRLDAPLIVHGV